MGLRRFAAAMMMVCGLGSLAGCPGFGIPDGAYTSAIPDGTYNGAVDATVEFWEAGELSEESGGGQTDATFRNRALQKDSGGEFQIGDVDVLDDGTYMITREVYDIDMGDWGYEIAFDLYAEWDSIPMHGWEIATYWLNPDGSVDLFDEIELTSADWYDGGTWTIHSDAYATLTSGSSPTPGPAPAPAPMPTPTPGPPFDILDLKSGKIRR